MKNVAEIKVEIKVKKKNNFAKRKITTQENCYTYSKILLHIFNIYASTHIYM